MTPAAREAIEYTFGEIGEALVQVAKMFFKDEDAASEAYQAFMYVYDRYDPERKKPFDEFAKETTYFLCKNERKRRWRWKVKNAQVEFKDSILVADYRAAPTVDADDSILPKFLAQLEGDAEYAVRYILHPPKSVKRAIERQTHDFACVTEQARLWRKALMTHLVTKKWTPWRIQKTFKTLKEAVESHFPVRMGSNMTIEIPDFVWSIVDDEEIAVTALGCYVVPKYTHGRLFKVYLFARNGQVTIGNYLDQQFRDKSKSKAVVVRPLHDTTKRILSQSDK